ncbi:hypothetical protein [Vulcanisaeta sp. JCM 16161]|uniref:hypothetical protein n=1 Tax=Vulcanisaeta sp. JCM 16161 TaxID=1295372 RepID=UPI000ACDA3FD|nr:hypothetical protein [Vulcanisaeta sp. JCM 16161]
MELAKFLRDVEELIGKDNVIKRENELSMYRRDWWSILMLKEVLGHSLIRHQPLLGLVVLTM